MREKSRMSEMSVSSVSPEQRMVFTRSHCAGLSEAADAEQTYLSASMPELSKYHEYLALQMHGGHGLPHVASRQKS